MSQAISESRLSKHTALLAVFLISGMMLKTDDIKKALRHKWGVLFGFVSTLAITPCLGFALREIHLIPEVRGRGLPDCSTAGLRSASWQSSPAAAIKRCLHQLSPAGSCGRMRDIRLMPEAWLASSSAGACNACMVQGTRLPALCVFGTSWQAPCRSSQDVLTRGRRQSVDQPAVDLPSPPLFNSPPITGLHNGPHLDDSGTTDAGHRHLIGPLLRRQRGPGAHADQ